MEQTDTPRLRLLPDVDRVPGGDDGSESELKKALLEMRFEFCNTCGRRMWAPDRCRYCDFEEDYERQYMR